MDRLKSLSLLALTVACAEEPQSKSELDSDDTASLVEDVLETGIPESDDEGALDSGDTGHIPDEPDAPEDPEDPDVALMFAPYVDATLYPFTKVDEVAAETGVDHFTLAFIVAGTGMDCEATWGTYYDLENGPSAWESGGEIFLYDHIDELRADGGEMMISFGGAANTPLAAGGCMDAVQLADEYDRVMETMNTVHVDFDVEGYWVADPASIDFRSQALLELQSMRAARGEDTQIWLTLPVMPEGLTPDGLNVVQSAVDYGLDLAGVNVMTMNYGESYDFDMGEQGIDAVTSLQGQVFDAYSGSKSDAEVWAMMGTTPMIGQNDVSVHFFELEDARETAEFAVEQGLGFVSFWSVARDVPCEEVTPWARFDCHGETADYADEGAYTEAFLREL